MRICPGCGEWLPHAPTTPGCPPPAGPEPGPDPGGPDLIAPVDWLADMGGRDQ